MRVHIFLTSLLLCLAVSTSAQNNIKKFNMEFGLGHSFAALTKGGAESIDYKVGFHIEGRFNLKSHPIAVGFHFGLSTFTRNYWMSPKFRSFAVMPIVDYSFRNGKRVNPFVGAGLGVAFNNIEGVFNHGFKTNICFMPRIGVRFFKHITLAFDYQFTHKDYSHMNFRIGYYF